MASPVVAATLYRPGLFLLLSASLAVDDNSSVSVDTMNLLGLFCEVFAFLVRCKVGIENWKRSVENEANEG